MIFSDKTLKHLLIFNLLAGVANLAMAIVTGVVGNLNLRPELYNAHQDFTWNNSTMMYDMVPTWHIYGNFPITILMVSIFSISAFFHFGNIMLWPALYYSKLENACSPFRWTDAFFGGSLLTTVIAFVAGVRSLSVIVLIAGASALVTSLLYLTDFNNRPKKDVDGWKEEKFLKRAKPHLMGAVLFAFVWVVILMNYFNGQSCLAPNWLWATVFVYFILSIVNFLPQVYQVANPPSMYVKGEFKYIVLTAVTKIAVGIILLSSVLAKNDFNSAAVKNDPFSCLAYPPPSSPPMSPSPSMPPPAAP